MSGLFQKGKAWGWAGLIFVACWAAGPARAAEWFVATNGSDAADGTNWATAKQTIQAAINAATNGSTVWVSNGVYATGGRAVYGAMTNRVVIDKPITVQSANGPAVTMIVGAWHPGTTNGDTAVRCVYVGTNATLIGFTLTNGATRKIGDVGREMAGGGAYCETSSVLTNCIVTGNSAHLFGGGVFRGVLYNCTISSNMNNQERGGGTCESSLYNCTLVGNSATAGGGAALGSLYNCTLVGNLAMNGLGGGAWAAALTNCTLASNSAYYGGGVYQCTLTNCVLTANSATTGGGTWESTLNNCTLVGNSATNGGGCSTYSILNDCTLLRNSAKIGGGGAYFCTLYNCTLMGNAAGRDGGGADFSTLNNCAIISNTATETGGGSLASTLNNCTISENEAQYGGGSYGDTLNNCIVYYNRSTLIIITKAGENHDGSTFNYCCTTPDPGGTGNITNEPQFVDTAAGNYRLQSNSPCINRGNNDLVQGTTDLDGNPRILNGVVDMGAYEYIPATWYVATNGNDSAAGTNWATAKATIQAAIDSAFSNDTVWVSNGVYATGGRAVYGAMTNRVVIDKPITVQSANGPAVTVIQGAWHPGTTNGDTAVRCVYVGTNATLIGFTLVNGATRTSGDYFKETSGGGAWCEVSGVLCNCTLVGNSAAGFGGGSFKGRLSRCLLTENMALQGGGSYGGTLNNCIVTSNSTSLYGGGSYGGTLNNCALTGNSAGSWGGGSFGSTLNNCTLVFNRAGSKGGGIDSGAQNNCIVYYNVAPNGANYNYDYNQFNFSCTTPMPGGTGNITNEPGFVNASHLAVGSPCIGAGNRDFASSTDIDGEAWLDPPSMGCDEVVIGSITGALTVNAWVAYTNVAVGFPVQFRSEIIGRASTSVWEWGDATCDTNRLMATHVFPSAGVYDVMLTAYNDSQPLGVAATVTVQVAEQETHHVCCGNATPAFPFTSWETAATNIQDAIDAASQVGARVWVSNGVYATGGRVMNGILTNRVVIDKPVVVQSVNGPSMTAIKGAWHPGTTNGDAALRCVYVGTNAALSGFMLTNGATRTNGEINSEQRGGGVWCETSGVVSNCTLTGNSAAERGGGSFQGLLIHCLLTRNWAHSGGGSANGTLNNCTLTSNSVSGDGGAAVEGTLNNCMLTGNTANYGGGTAGAELNECTLMGNIAMGGGGGSYGGVLYHCSVTSNSAASRGGGGSYDSDLNNCSLIGNSAGEDGGGAWDGKLNNCSLIGNSAGEDGGGAWGGHLNSCAVTGNSASGNGGGVSACWLTKCTLTSNTASEGGGSDWGFLTNCTLTGNSASGGGGGTFGGVLINCTLVGNSASGGGGGTSNGWLGNCIVFYNAAPSGPNYLDSFINYSCTTPDPGGTGNITNDPQFVNAAAGNYRLKTNSPCIDRGSNALVQGTTDLDGNPRILNGVVDMGAYETQLYTGFRAWAAAITNGLTNALDCAAGDGMPNLLRYVAGGHPMEADGLARLDLAFDSGLPTLLFNRNTNATDVTLVIQGADEMSDGATWRGLATNVNGSWSGATNVNEIGTGNPVVCSVEDAIPLLTNRFLRLKVTRP